MSHMHLQRFVSCQKLTMIALLRRFGRLLVPIRFDYVDATGQPLLGVERKFAVRDQYLVSAPDPRVDFRAAAAIVVGMDVLMDR